MHYPDLNYKKWLIVFIGIFSFGVGFGMLAFPKLLPKLIKGVSNLTTNKTTQTCNKFLLISQLIFQFKFQANKYDTKINASSFIRKNSILSRISPSIVECNKQRRSYGRK